MRAFIVLMIVFSGCAGFRPAQKWSHTDSVLEVSYFATMMTQWSHTDVMQHQCMEMNPALGQCTPDARMPPTVFFPLTVAVHAAVSAALPPDARRVWQSTTLGFSMAWTGKNLEISKSTDYDDSRAQCADAEAKFASGETTSPAASWCAEYRR